MSLTLKDCVNPWQSADRGLKFSGKLPVSSLPRLGGILLVNQGDVEVDLEFGRNEEKLPILKGSIKSTLILECQRCLEPLEMSFENDFSLAFVIAATEDSVQSDQYDLVEVIDDLVCLSDVIEDELLLLLPQVPMHLNPPCVIKTEFGDQEKPVIIEEKENPFAVLSSLKDKLNQ